MKKFDSLFAWMIGALVLIVTMMVGAFVLAADAPPPEPDITKMSDYQLGQADGDLGAQMNVLIDRAKVIQQQRDIIKAEMERRNPTKGTAKVVPPK